MKKLISLSFTLVFILSLRAQTIEGDGLLDIVGSTVSSPATQKFISDNKLIKTDVVTPSGTEYVSDGTYGIQADIRNDTLTMITLYRYYPTYGSYKHKLPKGITFGSSVDAVIKKLGKATYPHPAVGFYEYVCGQSILVCWFKDNKVLDQVIISRLSDRGLD